MLPFRWVLGDMTDNSPEEIPALLADLANVDEKMRISSCNEQ